MAKLKWQKQSQTRYRIAITSLFKLAQALENHWHISFQL
jgi:hypothetical protein